LWKFSKKKNFNSAISEKQFKITYRWLQLLLGLVLFLVANFLILTIYFFFYDEGQLKSNTFIINSTTGISFIFLVFGVLFFPEILYGLPNQKVTKMKSKNKISKVMKSLNSYNKESTTNYEDPLVELSERILDYFEKEKPYLKSNFSIAQIALKMEVPQSHVSYCINSIYKTKFSKMKTKLRVEQTKFFLQESVHSKITIDGIAQLAGFNSRSSFYIAFKEETGITPSDYLKTIIDGEKLKEKE
jgi:AraC-like DNA-binding protein